MVLPKTEAGFRGHALVAAKVAMHKERAGPKNPAFSCEESRNSGLFSFFLALFDLVAEALLSKVRFLPDES
ncbi:MAG: hypothetical protein E5W82_01450 [Mesorhizobium sp.]|uniref:hypothetical protein n=1 Tax=Mesorhizobium sp. TaxID=1871066 RepID=UPI0012193D07|nr:hypothetical protein [Mesorhizobium sp.]TIS54106.1 MAG: hypothetical protein E5W91_28070 [Mesorhizobium sp.]TIS87035.1 MAG: hypothetical protein E5W89_26515 [Mesorhizobium sp.]TJW17685.1 MAG: hypothetical protein E5W82_01450 [Mesorhizobium sp.]TJW48303.1 MAG: hypothetical protein E5W83_03370 [Mesorhizobium sp.]